jgi:hypothetical protein
MLVWRALVREVFAALWMSALQYLGVVRNERDRPNEVEINDLPLLEHLSPHYQGWHLGRTPNRYERHHQSGRQQAISNDLAARLDWHTGLLILLLTPAPIAPASSE